MAKGKEMGAEGEPQPEAAPVGPKPDDDVRIVSATLEFATNIGTWAKLSSAWHDLLSRRGYRPDSLENGPVLQAHVASISKLIDSLDTPVSEDAINRFIQQATGAAMVLNRSMQVVAVNASGRSTFGVEQGQFTDLRWIDTSATAKFRRFVTAPNDNQSFLAVRMGLPDRRNRLAEVSTLLKASGRDGLIGVRVLELVWDPANGQFLSEAFGLTEAEIDICRLLFLGHPAESIAQIRGASLRTVRTQLSMIFQKSETAGQVELVLLLAQLANRSYATPPMAARHFSDPLGREQILIRPDGIRMAYTWMGAEAGEPALFLHGGSHGYLFPAEFEDQLRARGVKLYVLSRPGFGHSERKQGIDCQEDLLLSIRHFFAALGKPPMPCVTVHYAAVPAAKLAASPDNPFTRLISYGEVMRYGHLNPRSATDQAKVFNWLARFAPWVNDANYKSAHRQLQHRRTEDVLTVMFSTHVYDLQLIERQDLFALFHHALNFISINGYRHEMEDETLRVNDVWKDIRRLKIPFHLIIGDVDSHHSPPKANDAFNDEIAALIRRDVIASLHRVPDAAFFAFHQNPDFMARTLADLILPPAS